MNDMSPEEVAKRLTAAFNELSTAMDGFTANMREFNALYSSNFEYTEEILELGLANEADLEF